MRLPRDVTRCHQTGNLIFEKRWPKAVLHLAPTRRAFRRSLGTPDLRSPTRGAPRPSVSSRPGSTSCAAG